MKIFVTGDTHGKIAKVLEVLKPLDDIDLIVHLGDCQEDAQRLETELETKVISVAGNMDDVWSFDNFKTFDTEYGKIFITHGHMDNVKFSHDKLLYHAEELNCRAVLFGHTHVPESTETDGIYIINPGSLSFPRDNTQGSYALITTSPEEFNCKIIYYSNQEKESEKKKRPLGGYLKGLLNYSDRF